MRHGIPGIGHTNDGKEIIQKGKQSVGDDFVFEKSIFSNIFEKDIRRVFVYKKAERLAKAIHLVAPAFAESEALRQRIDSIAVGLVDAAILAPSAARTALSRELLTLSSVLSIARTSGILSQMNADMISQEAHFLLQEIASYEEPHLTLDDAPTLSSIAKNVPRYDGLATRNTLTRVEQPAHKRDVAQDSSKGHLKDVIAHVAEPIKDRRQSILSVIRSKGSVSIKDVSHLIRGVSEKTIQRELQALIESGLVSKRGERRWSTYSLT